MATVSTRVLVRNALYANGGQLWKVLAAIVLTPIILERIGLAGYGVWALLFGLSGYVTMLETGFTTSLQKLTAELDRKGSQVILGEAVASTVLLLGAVGGAGLLALWWVAHWILPILRVPDAMLDSAVDAFLVIAIAATLRMSLGSVYAVLDGLQRMDVRVRLQVTASVVSFGVSLALLMRGWGLVGLAFGYLAGEALALSGGWIRLWRLYPPLAPHHLRPSRSGLRAVLAFGARLQGLALLNTAAGQSLRMLIAALCGVELLGAFDLAGRLLSLAQTPAMGLVAPLMPAFAHLKAGAEGSRWEDLFNGAAKAVSTASIIALGFAALFAESALYVWTRQSIPDAVFAVQVLAAGRFVNLLTGVSTQALRAAGTVRLELTYGALGATLSLLSAPIGYGLGGFSGMVIGLVCVRILSAGWFLQAAAKTWSIPLGRFLGPAMLRPALALAPLLVLLALSDGSFGSADLLERGRWFVAGQLATFAAVYLAACAPVGWFLIMAPAERAAIQQLLPDRFRPQAAAS